MIDLASHPSFQSGDVHTGFIDQHLDSLFPPITIPEQTIIQAVAAVVTTERNISISRSITQGCKGSPFAACDGFRVNTIFERKFDIESNEQKYNISLKYVGLNYEIKINDGEWKPLSVETIKDSYSNRCTLRQNLNGVESVFSTVIRENIIDVFNEVSYDKMHEFIV